MTSSLDRRAFAPIPARRREWRRGVPPVDGLCHTANDPAPVAPFLQGANGELSSVDRGAAAPTCLGKDQRTCIDRLAVVPVPEPASLAALGLGAIAMLRRRKRA